MRACVRAYVCVCVRQSAVMFSEVFEGFDYVAPIRPSPSPKSSPVATVPSHTPARAHAGSGGRVAAVCVCVPALTGSVVTVWTSSVHFLLGYGRSPPQALARRWEGVGGVTDTGSD